LTFWLKFVPPVTRIRRYVSTKFEASNDFDRIEAWDKRMNGRTYGRKLHGYNTVLPWGKIGRLRQCICLFHSNMKLFLNGSRLYVLYNSRLLRWSAVHKNWASALQLAQKITSKRRRTLRICGRLLLVCKRQCWHCSLND